MAIIRSFLHKYREDGQCSPEFQGLCRSCLFLSPQIWRFLHVGHLSCRVKLFIVSSLRRCRARMMQSRVQMYKEGWLDAYLPMLEQLYGRAIGDHSGAALADAYVKGIRTLDAVKAYEGSVQRFLLLIWRRIIGMERACRAIRSYMDNGYIPLEIW